MYIVLENLYFLFCLVGIGWTKEQILKFQAEEIDLDSLIIPIQIICNVDDVYTIKLTEDRTRTAWGFFLMMMTLPSFTNTKEKWETFSCQMNFDNLNFSWITTPGNEKSNEEFNQAVETQVTSVYKKSYIYKYYNVDVRTTNGIVHFYNLAKKTARTERYSVFLKIPDKSKLYFKSEDFWNTMFGSEWPEWILAQQLSQFPNGTQSQNSPGSKFVYTPPFYISFRSQGIEGNYFSFNRFNSPNLEDSILAMLYYDTTTNTLIPFFDPFLMIPYRDHITLTQDLEFKIWDSEKKVVQISDQSQLFIVLHLL